MKYQILIPDTMNAVGLKRAIIETVNNAQSSSDSEIRTWRVKSINNDSVLVHTEQWEEYGYLQLVPAQQNTKLNVIFCPGERVRKNLDHPERYLFGRFTELMLAHFWDKCDGIHIDK